jgi:hypothetical protein
MITRRDGQFVFDCDGDGSPHVLWTGVTDLRLRAGAEIYGRRELARGSAPG